MKICYDVNLTVRSVIDNLSPVGLTEGEPEITLFTVPAKIEEDESETVISYKEDTEGGEVFCRLALFPDGRIKLSRKGSVVWDTTFAEGESSKTLYSIPPYTFDLSLSTEKIRVSLKEGKGDVRLIYSMNIGGQDKKTTMKLSAAPRGNGGLLP